MAHFGITIAEALAKSVKKAALKRSQRLLQASQTAPAAGGAVSPSSTAANVPTRRTGRTPVEPLLLGQPLATGLLEAASLPSSVTGGPDVAPVLPASSPLAGLVSDRSKLVAAFVLAEVLAPPVGSR